MIFRKTGRKSEWVGNLGYLERFSPSQNGSEVGHQIPLDGLPGASFAWWKSFQMTRNHKSQSDFAPKYLANHTDSKEFAWTNLTVPLHLYSSGSNAQQESRTLGAMSAQKTLLGCEMERRELQVGTEEKSIFQAVSLIFPHGNSSIFYKKETENNFMGSLTRDTPGQDWSHRRRGHFRLHKQKILKKIQTVVLTVTVPFWFRKHASLLLISTDWTLSYSVRTPDFPGFWVCASSGVAVAGDPGWRWGLNVAGGGVRRIHFDFKATTNQLQHYWSQQLLASYRPDLSHLIAVVYIRHQSMWKGHAYKKKVQ